MPGRVMDLVQRGLSIFSFFSFFGDRAFAHLLILLFLTCRSKTGPRDLLRASQLGGRSIWELWERHQRLLCQVRRAVRVDGCKLRSFLTAGLVKIKKQQKSTEELALGKYHSKV